MLFVLTSTPEKRLTFYFAHVCAYINTSMDRSNAILNIKLIDTNTIHRACCHVSLMITGFPSVGKSTLLTNLAGVYSEVAAYEFTTLTTVPGVIRFKGAKIQVRYLDV